MYATGMLQSLCHRALAYGLILLAVSFGCGESNPEDTLSLTEDSVASEVLNTEVSEPEVTGPLCQGHSTYCDRPYNQVAQVCTHNAMASTVYDFYVPMPNQEYSITRQLNDGVRCLMLDTYSWKDELYLCHGDCAWGSLLMSDALEEIKTWMDDNPRDVVTFILESYITEDELWGALHTAGLSDPSEQPTDNDVLYYHNKPAGSPWPTLGWMIDNNQRLVVLTSDQKANGTWHLHWPTYGWETPYNDDTFTCAKGRGNPKAYDHQFFILNHYTLCLLGGCVENGEVNNAYSFVLERASKCWQKHPEHNPWQQIPTFVNLDQYHVPDEAGVPQAVLAVHALNAMWPKSQSK